MAGAEFYRADLHVHTFLAIGETAPASQPTVKKMVAAARRAKLGVVGITDHNNTRNVREAVALAGPDLLILPGIEITAADADIIALFSPDEIDALEALTHPDVLRLRVGPSGTRSRRSAAELIAEVGDRGGIAILAHIDTRDGFLARASNAAQSDVFAEEHLCGVEITDTTNKSLFTRSDNDPFRKQLMAERRSRLGWRASLARVMSSDAHSPEKVGVDAANRLLTRLRLDDLNFASVRSALRLHPESRCRLDADLVVAYPRVIAAEFVGGFVDGVHVELSDNLNCFIGGRGSGKSTILQAVAAALRGEADPDLDSHENMPDTTRVRYIDPLGTERTCVRHRFGTTYDESSEGNVLALSFVELEQNFGSELLVDPQTDPLVARRFLERFLPEPVGAAEEADVLARLTDSGMTLRRTTGSAKNLATAKKERGRLARMLTTATDAKLALVAEYASVLVQEAPLLAELTRMIDALPARVSDEVPDIDALAAQFDVDTAHEPASKFIPGPRGLKAALATLRTSLQAQDVARTAKITTLTKPTKAILSSWTLQHRKWERQIAIKSEELRKAGLTLQVAQLDKLRKDIALLDADIQRFEAGVTTYQQELRNRRDLIATLRSIRDQRFAESVSSSKRLATIVNQASSAAVVTLRWTREGVRTPFAELLGRLLDMRSPRKDRLAAIVSPHELAAIVWANDLGGLASIGTGEEMFVPDAPSAMDILRSFECLFELETMDLPDVAEIRVRFRGDPAGQFRGINTLSLGQLRSVLLGFLLNSPGNAPLILDQPEDQLDGPFVSAMVVPHLHATKEQRQLIIATHNPNIVVLGDAELVVPLYGVGSAGRPKDAGTIDSPATRDRIVDLLEGGLEAFERRGSRYGLL